MKKGFSIISMTLSAAMMTVLVLLVSVPIAFAVTPPYYKGPYQGYQYENNKFMEVAQLGFYDYSNPPTAPYPCMLHQGYSYTWNPYVFSGPIAMECAAWDQSNTLLYYAIGYGVDPGYTTVYWYPTSDAWTATTSVHQYYLNTQTNELFNPPPAEIGHSGN